MTPTITRTWHCHCRYQADQADQQAPVAADASMNSHPESAASADQHEIGQTTKATVAMSSGVATAVPIDTQTHEQDQQIHQGAQLETQEPNVNNMSVPPCITTTESTNRDQSLGLCQPMSPTSSAHPTAQFLQLIPIHLDFLLLIH